MFPFGAPVLFFRLILCVIIFDQTPIRSLWMCTLIIFISDHGGGLIRLFHCHPFDPVMILNWCFPENFEPSTSIDQSSEIIFSSRQRSGMEMNQTWRWKSEFGFQFVSRISNTNSFEAIAAVLFKSIFQKIPWRWSCHEITLFKYPWDFDDDFLQTVVFKKIERKYCKRKRKVCR